MPGDSRGHGYALAQEHFSIDGKDLRIGGVPVQVITDDTGTPAYIYDAGVIRRTYRQLASALDGFASIHYSMKANPAGAIVDLLLREGTGVEIASVGEYRIARTAGAAPDQILFAGPGKRVSELEEVIAGGIGEIHLESFEEIARVAAVGKSAGRPIRCTLRVNPDAWAQAGSLQMGGKPTAFGFDEQYIAHAVSAAVSAGNIDIVGIHVYAGTQILSAESLVRQWGYAIQVAAKTANILGKPLSTIDLGGGLGIPYYAGDRPLDLSALAAEIPELKKTVRSNHLLAQARVVIEPGRYLVGPAGLYVAQVSAAKLSRGNRFLVTDGGMHHHLAASGNLGQIVKRDYPLVAPARMNEAHCQQHAVVGPLCTPLDTLARQASLPALNAGDLIAVLQSGAYGLSASPSNFLGHPAPVEVLADEGSYRTL